MRIFLRYWVDFSPDITIYMCAKINLADVIILQHCRIACIRCVVGGAVIDGTASGESQTGLQTILVDHTTWCGFQFFTFGMKIIIKINDKISMWQSVVWFTFFLVYPDLDSAGISAPCQCIKDDELVIVSWYLIAELGMTCLYYGITRECEILQTTPNKQRTSENAKNGNYFKYDGDRQLSFYNFNQM